MLYKIVFCFYTSLKIEAKTFSFDTHSEQNKSTSKTNIATNMSLSLKS